MDRERISGNWHQLMGKIKQRWGQLTDDEIAQSEGRAEELIGKIQEKYGGTREDIRRELDRMLG